MARLGRSGHRCRRGCWRGRCGAWCHRPSLGVTAVALGDIDRHFAWQACHYGAGLPLVARLGQWTPLSPRLLAWQVWHLVTSTVTLRGRRGAWRHRPSLALVARLGRSGRRCRRGCWRGRCGAWCHRPSLGVTAVALGDIDRHFAWQAWHLSHWTGSGGALGPHWTPLSPRLLAWQVWQLVTSTVALRGRRGAWRHRPSLCVADVALGDIDRHFAWQAWHLSHWTGSGGALGSPLDAIVATAVGVAGVALGDIDLHFAWQAWRLVTSTVTWRGRCGICGTGLALTPSLTHHFLTNHLSHTIFHHTIFYTQLCHTPSLTQHFVTHHLSHTTLSHTTLSHTPPFTHHFVTRHVVTHHRFHTPSFTHHL